MRGFGFDADRHGPGAGRFDRGHGRNHDSNVWKRKSDAALSSTNVTS